jgi:hypothetical protein
MGIFHFSQIMANPSCGWFANPVTSQKFLKKKKKKKKKPNPNLIMHHLLLFLHHLCKSYNHKKKRFHLPHQHDADDGDHLFMSIRKEEGNHPSEDKQEEEAEDEEEASHPNPSTSSPPSLSLSHTQNPSSESS